MTIIPTQTTSIDPSNTITAMQLRRTSGKLLDRVFYKGERFVIEKAGEPRAAIVPLAELEDMERIKREARERFWKMTQELQAAFKDTDPSEVEREINQAIDEVRRQKTANPKA